MKLIIFLILSCFVLADAYAVSCFDYTGTYKIYSARDHEFTGETREWNQVDCEKIKVTANCEQGYECSSDSNAKYPKTYVLNVDGVDHGGGPTTYRWEFAENTLVYTHIYDESGSGHFRTDRYFWVPLANGDLELHACLRYVGRNLPPGPHCRENDSGWIWYNWIKSDLMSWRTL